MCVRSKSQFSLENRRPPVAQVLIETTLTKIRPLLVFGKRRERMVGVVWERQFGRSSVGYLKKARGWRFGPGFLDSTV